MENEQVITENAADTTEAPTLLSEQQYERGAVTLAADAEFQAPAHNGDPAAIVRLARGQVLHIITCSRDGGFLLRGDAGPVRVSLADAGQIFVHRR